MRLDQLAPNSRESMHRLLGCVAAEIGRGAGDGGSDENDEGCSPEYVSGGKVRCDEQGEREQRSKDRCVVDQQMEVCA